MKLRTRVWTQLPKQITAVIQFSSNTFRCGADIAQQIFAPEVLHKILTVRRDAEWNPGNFLEEKRGVRCTIRKMDVHMIHATAREEIREIQSVPRAQFRFRTASVFLLVLLDERLWPFVPRLRNPARL